MPKLSDQTANAFALAEQEARLMERNLVGTEHLLLGLLCQQGIVFRAMASLGIYLDNCRKTLRYRIGSKAQLVPDAIPFSPRAKRVMQRADALAAARSSEEIEPQHILLAIIEDDEATASEIISSDLEVDLEDVEDRLLEMMNGEVFPPAIPIDVYTGDYEFHTANHLEALRWLATTDSFITAAALPDSLKNLLGPNKPLLGAYINSEDDCIVLCEEELYWLDGAAQTEISYNSIASVELPTSPNDPYLKLELDESKKIVMLPVQNLTEEADDFEFMFEFLYYRSKAAHYILPPKLETVPVPIAFPIIAINSQADFIKYVQQPAFNNHNLSRLVGWLQRGALDKVWLAKLEIDEKQIKSGSFWRLFAAMLMRFPELAEEPPPAES